MCEAHGQGLQVQPRHPGFPHAMFDGLYVLSPVSGVYCHRCQPRTGGADRRHGRGARTTRLRRTLYVLRQAWRTTPALTASIASPATFRDDRETSLWWHGVGVMYYDLRKMSRGDFENRNSWKPDAA